MIIIITLLLLILLFASNSTGCWGNSSEHETLCPCLVKFIYLWVEEKKNKQVKQTKLPSDVITNCDVS